VGEWLARGRQLPPTHAAAAPTINEVLLAYYRHAETYYRKPGGRPTSELHCIRSALRPVKQLYGDSDAAAFDSLCLQSIQRRMIQAGLARKTINDGIHRIRRAFKWAAKQQIVPISTHQSLLTVEALKAGRSEARESTVVRPVPQALIDGVRDLVAPQVWAMIQIQLLTGARPGEVCLMRACDLETGGKVWTFRPITHKTEHHGFERQIYIGPRCQEIIKPFLQLDTSAFLFSPADAEQARRERQRADRKTPLYPSHLRRLEKKRKRRSGRAPGSRYTVDTYRRAIQRACDLAFPPPAELLVDDSKAADLQRWRMKHRWFPHQLRHNAGTNLRKQFGIEVSRIILGHQSVAVNEIYSEPDRTQATAIIARIG
jgi:integrase